MRFDLTRPCGNCPFRSDEPFYLRPERVREILGGGKGKAWWPSPSFVCHKTIDYDAEAIPKELIDRFHQRYVVDDATGCWNWTRALDHYGYGVIGFGPRKSHQTHKAHRLSFEIELGLTLPPEIDVCHSCGNRRCVAPQHLFIGDYAVAKRRTNYRPLSIEEVKAMRDDYEYGSSTRGLQGLADKYGCSVTHVHRIVHLRSRVVYKNDAPQQCAGVMAILHRENRPNDAMQIAERLGLWNPATLDPAAPFYESTQAAIEGQGSS